MKPPGFGITISQPTQLESDDTLTSMSFQDITISGNRAGLLELAERIRKVAESTQDGYHTHLWPDDEDPLLRSKDFGLTISLNSVK